MISSKTFDAFLALVRLGIGHESRVPSQEIDWTAIKALADAHGLSAVVLEGIDKCHTDTTDSTEMLPLQLKLEWIGEVLQNYEAKYKQYEKAISSLAGWYNQHGFKMMVLKGYACSLDWPNPKHRPCGDIDVWQFGKQKEADALLESSEFRDESVESVDTVKRIKVDNSHHHHTVFYWRDFMVENHFDFLNVHHHKSNIEMEAILKKLGQDDSHYLLLNGEKVYLPSPNLHALFLLRHSMSNFASTRMQLRQLMDWAFFVKANQEIIDWNWLEDTLEQFGMKKMYDVFNAICVGDLGFNVSIFPTVQFDPALKDRVLKEIVSPENYQKTPSNLLLRIPFKYRRWKENGWKHSLCFNDSMISAFWSGVKSHLLKPSSI